MKTIAVDVDDVLAALAQDFIGFTNKKWGTHLTIDDYDEHWAKVWKVEFDEESKRIKAIFSSGIFKNVNPFPEAEPVLKKLSKKYKLVVLTSRERNLNKDTHDWLDNHFKEVFSEVHFSGIWDDYMHSGGERINRTKADLASEIGADYLIDDQTKHCLAAAKVGIEAILFGDYAWNRLNKLPSKVTRLKDWQEILEYFDAKSR